MAAIHVKKSVQIAARPEAVFPKIRDFRQWGAWSPWLLAEPDCPVQFGPEGKTYRWDGKITGSGEMEVLAEEAGKAIDYRLTFLKPFKSEAKTAFRLEARGEGTELTWTMDSSLPWFLFWMSGMMTAMVGMDYERGLKMIKDLAETGAVPSRLAFPGVTTVPGFAYLGVRTHGRIDRIGEDMGRDFGKLQEAVKAGTIQAAGAPFSIYHRWDVGKGLVEYTVGAPVAGEGAAPAGFVSGRHPGGKVYAIEHTGAYEHLGNAWAAAMMRAQAKVFAQNGKVHPFEVYASDPEKTPANKAVTMIYMPVK